MQASNFDQVHINASILYSYYSPIIVNDVSVSYSQYLNDTIWIYILVLTDKICFSNFDTIWLDNFSEAALIIL